MAIPSFVFFMERIGIDVDIDGDFPSFIDDRDGRHDMRGYLNSVNQLLSVHGTDFLHMQHRTNTNLLLATIMVCLTIILRDRLVV